MSIGVTDREARSAAVNDREARSAAANEREVPGTLVDPPACQAAAQLLSQSARRCQPMREVQEQLQRLARGEQPVWINGELGSGRQSAALTLHQQSGLRSGPCRVCHRAELAPIAALVLAESSAAQQEGLSRLQALLTRTRGGTLILDEGGTPDPAFQVLVLELLRLRQSPATRLVLLTCANQEGAGEAEPPLLPALLSSLSGRLLRVPALRVRREEIADLALELWRTAPRQRSAEAPPPQMTPAVEAPLSVAVSADAAGEEAAPEISAASAVSDAAPAPPEAPVGAAPVDEAPTLEEDTLELLREQPWPGNLHQLRHLLLFVAQRSRDATLGRAELTALLPLTFQPGPPEAEPEQLQTRAQALQDLLRPMVPTLGAASEEPPWAPLLLVPVGRAAPPSAGAADDPRRLWLRRGPAPLDDARLVAGLQARPRGLVAGGRTGDAPALAQLGQTWRGNLLGLLRATYHELGDLGRPGSSGLSLLTLAQLLTLSGPPLSALKLLRLSLHLPTDLNEEESAALLRRMHPASRQRGRLPCASPQVGRSWADAARGLLPQGAEGRFLEHATRCERCGLLLQGYFRLTLREPWHSPEPLWEPAAAAVAEAVVVGPSGRRRPEDVTLIDVTQAAAAAEAAGQSCVDLSAPEEAAVPAPEADADALRWAALSQGPAPRRPRRPHTGPADGVPRPIPDPRQRPAADEASAEASSEPVSAPPSAASPTLLPPPMAAAAGWLSPGRLLLLALLWLGSVVASAVLGYWMARR